MPETVSTPTPAPAAAGRLPLLALGAGAVMISFSGVWVQTAHVAPEVSAFYRAFIGGLVLLLAAAVRGELRRPRAAHLWWALACGALFALDLAFFHLSVRRVGPGLGTILPNFQVFLVAACGVALLGEPARAAHLASLPLAVAGLFLVVGVDWSRLPAGYRSGVGFGLAAAVFYAAFILALRRLQAAQAGGSVFAVLMAVSLASAGFLAPVAARSGAGLAVGDLRSLASLLALGVLSHAVGWALITNALPRVRASLSGLVLLLQPALAFVWDVAFFGRPTTGANWLGVALTLGAIYLGTAAARGGRR